MRSGSRFYIWAILVFLLLFGSTACGGSVESVVEEPAVEEPPAETVDEEAAVPPAEEVTAKTLEVDVRTRIDGDEAALERNESESLKQGDGVKVIDAGHALLTFEDRLRVELFRDGDIELQQFTASDNDLFARFVQGLGATFNQLSVEDTIEARFEIETDFAIIEATGTEFMVDYEEGTPLEWIVAMDAGADDLIVRAKDDGTPRTLSSGQAVWVAPIGPASEPVAADMDLVIDWMNNARDGNVVPEIGEVIWPQAPVNVTTASLQPPINAGDSLLLGNVALTLESGGSYAIEDCTGDGRNEIRVQDGSILFDVRGINIRLRELHARIFNDGQPDEATLLGYNPAGPGSGPIDQASASAGNGEQDIITITSPDQPYHFARLALEDGCFSELLLTHPDADEELAPISTATSTTTPSREPTASATPTRMPTATATFTPTPTPYPGVADLYSPGYGSEMLCLSEEEILPVTFEWGAAQSARAIEHYEIEARITFRDGSETSDNYATDGPDTNLYIEIPCYTEQVDWRVRAIDNAGSVGAWSGSAYFLVRLDPPPPAPVLVEPANGDELFCEEELELLLDWQSVDDASGISRYDIAFYFAELESGDELSVPGDQSEFVLYVPCAAGTVFWQVRAVDGTDMVGEWSDEAFFYVEFNEPPPAPVIVAPSYGTIISCADEGPLVLDWQAVEDESGIIAYELELSVPGSGSDVITSSGDETEIELPEFCIPGTWSWQVRAIDGTYVEGEWSDYMEFEVVEEQPEPGLPDLVIASVSQIGDLQGSENGPVEAPVEVVVINQGSGTAESQFKIEINYSSESGSGLAPFTVEGQGFWYPFIEGLAPGEFASVSGIVTLPDDVQGYWTTVWAIADSCSGDEFMPSYCRVEEGNEENNGGGSIDIEIPVYID